MHAPQSGSEVRGRTSAEQAGKRQALGTPFTPEGAALTPHQGGAHGLAVVGVDDEVSAVLVKLVPARLVQQLLELAHRLGVQVVLATRGGSACRCDVEMAC